MSHEHGAGPGMERSLDEPSASDCAEFLDRIVYFIDNELDEADCSAVRVHLDSCNPCLEKYDLQRTVKSVVARSCTEVAPDDLRQRVLFKIREVQVQIREG
jgi:mycothiol system anti-sigma-R factor